MKCPAAARNAAINTGTRTRARARAKFPSREFFLSFFFLARASVQFSEKRSLVFTIDAARCPSRTLPATNVES